MPSDELNVELASVFSRYEILGYVKETTVPSEIQWESFFFF